MPGVYSTLLPSALSLSCRGTRWLRPTTRWSWLTEDCCVSLRRWGAGRGGGGWSCLPEISQQKVSITYQCTVIKLCITLLHNNSSAVEHDAQDSGSDCTARPASSKAAPPTAAGGVATTPRADQSVDNQPEQQRERSQATTELADLSLDLFMMLRAGSPRAKPAPPPSRECHAPP